ncbi:MAG TPA: aromatic amino acid ammonia-lyase [Casimicrobiaceae bacterium]|nr:aromatic amino acid ammonia-lyase [Casimicrobiaceae bacterium]
MILRLGERAVTLGDLLAVARGRAEVEVGAQARHRVEQARATVERAATSDTPVYGVNSALGANTGQRIAPQDLADYQRRAVRARAVGVGEPLDVVCVRAMMFARACGMAQGGSGVSPHVLDALIAMLNRGVHPVVPGIGSISVADLPPLAHLALVLIGEGNAEFDGVRSDGADAMQRAGLAPITLAAKDGLALVSANAATIASAALAIERVQRILASWLSAVALSFEAFGANLSPFEPLAVAARPARGQVEVAARLRELLAGSALLQPGHARRVQDPLSFRLVAQVHGAAHWLTDEARAQIELELNSAADSPLVANDTMLSNGNFHVPALAITLDACALALAQVASLGVQRCQRFMAPQFTDLPLQLTTRGPAHSGFATIQKTLTSLWAQVRHLANPGSLDFFPVSEAIEDHATMALLVAEKLAAMATKCEYIAAIELLIAAQALDLCDGANHARGGGASEAYQHVRGLVPMLDEDRPLGPDVDAIAGQVSTGAFVAADRAA